MSENIFKKKQNRYLKLLELGKYPLIKESIDDLRNDICQSYKDLNPNFKDTFMDLIYSFLVEGEIYAKISDNKFTQILSCRIIPTFSNNKIDGYITETNIKYDKDSILYENYGLYGETILDVKGYLDSAILTYNEIQLIQKENNESDLDYFHTKLKKCLKIICNKTDIREQTIYKNFVERLVQRLMPVYDYLNPKYVIV